MTLPADKTAIVLIEAQNDFLTKGGTMFQYIEEQLKQRNVIANLQKLLKGARSKKVKIFYCPFQAFKPGFPELKPGGPGTGGLRGIEMEMKADWGTGAWLDGTPGPEIIKELTPEDSDIIVRGKLTLDAFHSTAINYLLRANEIEHVAVCGFHTNWCVESTARSAYDHGFRVIIIGDCTATDTEREQKYAEEVIFPKIGRVMTADSFLAEVK